MSNIHGFNNLNNNNQNSNNRREQLNYSNINNPISMMGINNEDLQLMGN
jgi:hypothetical protein